MFNRFCPNISTEYLLFRFRFGLKKIISHRKLPCQHLGHITAYGARLVVCTTLQWRHNEHGGVSIHQRLDRLLHRSCRRRSEKTPKLRAIGLCEGNTPMTGEFPAQRACNAEKVSIWWRHHDSIPPTFPSYSLYWPIGFFYRSHEMIYPATVKY